MAFEDAVELTVVNLSSAGKSADYTLVTPTETNGNKFHNDGRTFLHIINGDEGSVVVTIDCPGTFDGQPLAELTVTLLGSGNVNGLDDQLIGPFSKVFCQPGTDYVWVVCDRCTLTLIGAFRI